MDQPVVSKEDIMVIEFGDPKVHDFPVFCPHSHIEFYMVGDPSWAIFCSIRIQHSELMW